MAMTAKMIRFCQEYMIDMNATQAAIRAGYSEDSAYSIGSENLSKPEISDYLEVLRKRAADAADVSKDRIIQELKRVAFFDIRQIYGVDGGLKPIRELDDDTAAVVVSVKSYEEKTADEEDPTIGIVREVKIADKLKAIDTLNKMLGFNAPEEIKADITSQITWNETKTYTDPNA